MISPGSTATTRPRRTAATERICSSWDLLIVAPLKTRGGSPPGKMRAQMPSFSRPKATLMESDASRSAGKNFAIAS